MKITFVPMTASHFPLFKKWLKAPHIQPYWSESDDEDELRDKFLTRLPDRGFSPFIVEIDGQPVGYMQYYEACRAGDGWWPDAKPGVFGIDQMIGEPAWVGKGLAPVLIEEFIQMIATQEAASEIIIDPDPENHRAIRAFEKAGFIREGVVDTPNGKAMLMKRLLRPALSGA
jgi:RimJ/RimL family protein N-acetyltransferase